jgi:hypothetical protein
MQSKLRPPLLKVSFINDVKYNQQVMLDWERIEWITKGYKVRRFRRGLKSYPTSYPRPDTSTTSADMNLPLYGDGIRSRMIWLATWAVSVSRNWRLTFTF